MDELRPKPVNPLKRSVKRRLQQLFDNKLSGLEDYTTSRIEKNSKARIWSAQRAQFGRYGPQGEFGDGWGRIPRFVKSRFQRLDHIRKVLGNFEPEWRYEGARRKYSRKNPRDPKYSRWLLAIDKLLRKTIQMGRKDLPSDYMWADAFEIGLSPTQAINMLVGPLDDPKRLRENIWIEGAGFGDLQRQKVSNEDITKMALGILAEHVNETKSDDDLSLDQLIFIKSRLLMDLQLAQGSINPSTLKIFDLISKAAGLEGRIAKIYLAQKNPEFAVINLISQASLLVEATQLGTDFKSISRITLRRHALRILDEAKKLTKKLAVKTEIEQLKVWAKEERQNPDEKVDEKNDVKVICAWCQKHMKGREDAPFISHGVCRDCFNKQMDDLKKESG